MTQLEKSVWKPVDMVIVIQPAPGRGYLAELIEPRKGPLRLGAETLEELMLELANWMKGRAI